MMERTVLRVMIGILVPISSALIVEQLPKTRVAKVPFAFQVGDQAFPPGTYSIHETGLGRGIRIQNKTIATAGILCAEARHQFGKLQPARLVFADDEGQYRLSEIWLDADGRGVVLRQDQKQRAERAGEPKCVWLQ
jgi:hypothetical protein